MRLYMGNMTTTAPKVTAKRLDKRARQQDERRRWAEHAGAWWAFQECGAKAARKKGKAIEAAYHARKAEEAEAVASMGQGKPRTCVRYTR